MHRKLPIEIDPFRFAQNGIQLEGEIQLRKMPRLGQSLLSNEGIVNVKMEFDVDEVGTPFMHGTFSCSVSMICERCMKPMDVVLNTDSLLAMVISERKIDGLAEQYEPWLLENNDPVELSTIVEDELILNLPLVPRHEEMCLPSDAWTVGDDENIESEKRESPFAMLAELKTKH